MSRDFRYGSRAARATTSAARPVYLRPVVSLNSAALGQRTKSLRDSGGWGLVLSAVPREEIVDSERSALS